LVSLSGSTFPPAKGDASKLSLTLSGTMTQVTAGQDVTQLGFGPKIAFAGTVSSNYDVLKLKSGVVNADSSSLPTSPKPPTYFSLHLSSKEKDKIYRPQQLSKSYSPFIVTSASMLGSGSGGGGGGSPKAGGSSSSAGTSQFSSQIVFTISYGVNGGPTWSIRTFKGPGAGSGPLASLSRTNTDTLSITFVPACSNSAPSLTPKNYWQSLPQCENAGPGPRQAAAAAGAINNQLMQFH
jgi:hypothetical protein